MAHADIDRTLNYVELKVADLARTKAFYEKAFGWTYTDYGPTYCEFNDGQMKGGFEQTDPADIQAAGGPLVVLYGADLTAVQKDIEAAGGEITLPVFSFPGGERFHFKDPDGYEMAVWCANG